MLEKLTLNNMDTFKEIYNKNFKKISYNKDFFRCYEEQNFLLKFLYRKFIRLIIINDECIGYIWYENGSGKYIKVWALYIDSSYTDTIDESILSSFDNNILYYEEIESIENTIIFNKLGFRKDNYTLLLKLNTTNYDNIELKLKSEDKNEEGSNSNKYGYNKDNLSIRKLYVGKDEILRCNIQNDIFSQWNRRPLTVDDIYADMTQDYYLKDLCFFGMLNNDYIGYGQIIFNRNMYTIVNFGMVAKYRGKGLSKIFLSKIIKAAKNYGIEDLYIRVDSNNVKAINLYKSIGFKEVNKVIVWERGH
ncbi:GNAT family N-acetyltransferase [Clostridium sp. AL.422]|uniref:GNAT family N-acetyltransferase n=1 Tax=Clostridium TaxID=1485 RepID=UPI00293DCEE2|nr:MULTISPECIES: GNAT family N-acetyltransferase [unclassified Clostridium]MDV4151779.1 GNAT family N-acetyltransferase [Clostridium sp. AL.422]